MNSVFTLCTLIAADGSRDKINPFLSILFLTSSLWLRTIFQTYAYPKSCSSTLFHCSSAALRDREKILVSHFPNYYSRYISIRAEAAWCRGEGGGTMEIM